MRTVLQFSGGKDSLACLYLYRKQWDEITVAWLNTGAAYPDVVAYMEGWKRRIPNFVEIRSNQPRNVELNGFPSDVVPLRYTPFGRSQVAGSESFRIQSYFQCCHDNIWIPMHRAMKELGATTIIRGQRVADHRKSSVRDGAVVDGVTYRMPIESWSDADVFGYLKECGAELPPYYSTEKTSRDCWSCTAYRDESVRRVRNLPAEQRAEVERRLRLIREAILAESAGYMEI